MLGFDTVLIIRDPDDWTGVYFNSTLVAQDHTILEYDLLFELQKCIHRPIHAVIKYYDMAAANLRYLPKNLEDLDTTYFE